jgi:hypothetical protein
VIDLETIQAAASARLAADSGSRLMANSANRLTVANPATSPISQLAGLAVSHEAEHDPDRCCWPHGAGWNTREIEKFITRRDRLQRWAWPEDAAEALAERLLHRDRDRDDHRHACVECAHYRPGRCTDHHRAGLTAPELSRDLASLPQRCPAFTHRLENT